MCVAFCCHVVIDGKDGKRLETCECVAFCCHVVICLLV